MRPSRWSVVVAMVATCGLYAGGLPRQARAWVPGAAGKIAFASDAGRPGDALGTHIWTMNADGSGSQELTSGNDDFPSWSPTGRLIAFSRADGRIWVMSNTGADQRPLTPAPPSTAAPGSGFIRPRFSPDGSEVAFVSTNEYAEDQVWVINTDGSDMRQVTDLPDFDIEALTWSPDGAHLLFWADDYPAPAGQFHIYEMSSDGSEIAPIAYQPGPPLLLPGWIGVGLEGDQVGGLDWGPNGIAISVLFDGIHIGSSADPSPPTPVMFGGGTGLAPTWSPNSSRIPQLAFSWSSSVRKYLGGGDEPFELYRTNPLQQITFGPADHNNPSWGPPPGAQRVPSYRPMASVVRALERGSRTVRVLLPCGSTAGRAGCLEQLIASSSSGGLSSQSYQVQAGRSRLVTLRLNAALASSLTVGKELLLALRAKVRGRVSIERQQARVFAPASVEGACPAPNVQFGSSVTVSGVLHASPGVVAGTAAAASGVRVGLVASQTAGRTETVSAKTDSDGHYTLTFIPAAPGVWTLQVVWNGDRTHASTESLECSVSVSAPPPLQETVAVTCHDGTAGSPVSVAGSLTPGALGAEVKLAYQRQGAAGDTITDTVAAASDGTFTDNPTPDASGTWTVVASYAGDSARQAATSTPCSFAVSPQQTALALTCPGKSPLGNPLEISGTITPALKGESITLTYTHQTQGPLETFTSTETTDANGQFSDASIRPNDAGEWDVSASFAGDSARAPASSPPCAISVS